MLMGEYNHALDAKGRIIIPSRLREELGEHFVVCKGMDGCLFAFPMEGWEKLVGKLQALPLTNKAARKFSRYFLAGAADVEPDKQGRALLPQTLREAAHLEKDVVLCGVGDRLEIWSRDAWTAESHYENIDELSEMMAELGI